MHRCCHQSNESLRPCDTAVWLRLGVTIRFVTHDIDESVYLGERIIILSSSPTVVLEDLAVDLPAERDQLTTRAGPRFVELRGHVYAKCKGQGQRRKN